MSKVLEGLVEWSLDSVCVEAVLEVWRVRLVDCVGGEKCLYRLGEVLVGPWCAACLMEIRAVFCNIWLALF